MDIIEWPNPAMNTVNVKFVNSRAASAVIDITDVLGKQLSKVKRKISRGAIIPVNVSTLPAGMYFIRVSAGNSVSVSKFIKE